MIWWQLLNMLTIKKEKIKMTQEEFNEKVKALEDQIKKSQAELEELKAVKVEEPQRRIKRWKPDFGERYWTVTSGGDVDTTYWADDIHDRWRYLTGNCFKTKEEAEESKKQIEYTARYKKYIEEHSEPIDWEDFNQNKYLAVFDFRNHSVSVDWGHLIKKQGTIYASSEEIIWDAINCVEEGNFKKYVLGVK